MNKRVILILGLLVGVSAVLWLVYLFGSRKLETGSSSPKFRIASLDDRSKAFILERESNWVALDGDYSAFSALMRESRMIPSVRSLTNQLTSSTPAYIRWKFYWWAFPRRATVVNGLATMKQSLLEIATLDNRNEDPRFQVADDGHLGLLWMGTNAVLVFQDGTNGLQETQYREKTNGSHSGGLSTEGTRSLN